MRQAPSENPIQFYEKVMGILNTISNYVEVHTANADVKRSKLDFFRQQALTTFLAGLREPLCSTVRAMRPGNLAEAMQYIQEENNIRYSQRNQMPMSSNGKLATNTSAPRQLMFRPPIHQPLQPAPTQWQPPAPALWQQPSPAVRQPNHQPFFKPQQQSNFRPTFTQPGFEMKQPARPANQQNVWAPKPGPSQQPKPTPMTIATTATFKNRQPNQNNFGPRPSQPNFTFEELYNIEQAGGSYGYEEDAYETEYLATGPSTYERQEFQYEEEVNFPMDPNEDQET